MQKGPIDLNKLLYEHTKQILDAVPGSKACFIFLDDGAGVACAGDGELSHMVEVTFPRMKEAMANVMKSSRTEYFENKKKN